MDTCPRCNLPLDRGYVAHGGLSGIVWTAQPLKLGQGVGKAGPDYHLLHRRSLKPANIPAARCSACQLVLMDYSES